MQTGGRLKRCSACFFVVTLSQINISGLSLGVPGFLFFFASCTEGMTAGLAAGERFGNVLFFLFRIG